VAERFAISSGERIDPTKLSLNNKPYTALWTNRVAMWRFFARYVEPFVKVGLIDDGEEMRFHRDRLCEVGGINPAKIPWENPFACYGHAFEHVMNAWYPCIRKIVKGYENNTRNGHGLKEDFHQIAAIAFLHALEKQAMAILANAKLSQGIPFPMRLEYAVRKAINSDLPDHTGPVRVPVESKQRKMMPIEVSLDVWALEESDW
jgi:hypothetical protein